MVSWRGGGGVRALVGGKMGGDEVGARDGEGWKPGFGLLGFGLGIRGFEFWMWLVDGVCVMFFLFDDFFG